MVRLERPASISRRVRAVERRAALPDEPLPRMVNSIAVTLPSQWLAVV